jgi:hypothetical protein
MRPEEELAGLLPPAPAAQQLPRQALHRSSLLAAIAAESARPRAVRRTPVAGWPAARHWLVPAGAAAAVCAVVVAATVLSGAVAHHHAGRPVRPSQAGRSTPAQSGRLTGTRHWTVRSGGLRGVVLRTNSGSITVTGGAGDGLVAITARPDYRGAAPVVSSTVTSGVLTVSALCPNSSGSTSSCTVTVLVSLPRSVPVRASTELGSVNVTSLDGGVAVTDQFGAISLSGLAGPIAATDDFGDIHGQGLDSKSATLSAEFGQIDAAFSAPPDRVDANDEDGSVTITVPVSVSYRVDASQEFGGMTVTVPESASSAHVIIASTELGSVTVSG